VSANKTILNPNIIRLNFSITGRCRLKCNICAGPLCFATFNSYDRVDGKDDTKLYISLGAILFIGIGGVTFRQVERSAACI